MIDQNITLILPLIAAIGAAIAVLIVDLILPNRSSLTVTVALIGLAVVAVADRVREPDTPAWRTAASTRSTR